MPQAHNRLKNRKPEVELRSTDSVYTPFAIMVPELLMEMMEHLRGQKMTQARQ